MNIDELRSVQNGEREAASLQNLRSTFYEDAGRFIAELETERDRAAERSDDPFASPEVRRLTDDIETAKSTVEAIYDRRVGKVVEMASIAAAEMPTAEENLTNEERELFETLVDRIADNRAHVLEEVLEGDGSGISCTRTAEAGAETEPPSETEPGAPRDAPAGSFMGGDDPPADPEDDDGPAAGGADTVDAVDADSGATADPGPDSNPDPIPGTDPDASVDRSLVRITSDVGELFGVDDREYELSTDDVITLPEANAGPLVERDAAERLE